MELYELQLNRKNLRAENELNSSLGHSCNPKN